RGARAALPDPAAKLVLPGCRVDADPDADQRHDGRGPEHALRADPHAERHLVVDRAAGGTHAPVPAQDDAREPGPPSFQQRDCGGEVARPKQILDLPGAHRWFASDVVAARAE